MWLQEHGIVNRSKEILYFDHERYVIASGMWKVTGSGAGYDIERAEPYCAGTASLVFWKGHVAEQLRMHFRKFVQLTESNRKVMIDSDGEILKPAMEGGEPTRVLHEDGEAGWAEVRLSKQHRNLLVVRIGGIPMFHHRCDYKGTVIVDLIGSSVKTMTSNRDGLKYPYTGRLSDFITTIAVDRHSALKKEEAVYTRYEGVTLNAEGGGRHPTAEEVEACGWPPTGAPLAGAGIAVLVNGRIEAPPSVLKHEFIIKNCTRRAVPREFVPTELAFSDHAHWLVRAWAGSLVELYELHELHEDTRTFSVGFIISQDAEAEMEHSSNYGLVYFLNPCKVGKKGTTRRFTRANRFQIVADAAHEFVHGGLHENYHGEDYANKLTEVMALVMKNMGRFTKHLK